jgi:integrase
MGSIRRPRDGRGWEARYRGPTGHYRSRTFPTKREATRFLIEVEGDKARGSWVDPAGGRLLLESWVDQWWSTTTNLRPTTRVRDENYLANYILPAFGAVPLGRVTHLDVRTWVAELDDRGLAPATIVKAYQILGKVMQAAVDGGLIAISPCRRVPLPKIEREEMRFLNPAEVNRLADAIDDRFRALVLVGSYGGLRRSELAGLRMSRVDLLRGHVDVAEIMVEVQGKATFGPPKTRAGRRVVGLPRGVVDELAGHLSRRPNRLNDFVFQGPEGSVLRASPFRQRFWVPAVRAAGLEPLRLHDLRHTAVSFWIAAGASVKDIAVRAGHASVASVIDRYGHLMPDADAQLRDRLDAMLTAADALPSAAVEGAVVPLRTAP